MPAGCPTHVAWQVGHLAMAEYGLGLFRQRGRQEIDAELMSSSFRKQFSRGSVPEADATKYPSPAEIRAVFDRVHAQVLKEVPGFIAASPAMGRCSRRVNRVSAVDFAEFKLRLSLRSSAEA